MPCGDDFAVYSVNEQDVSALVIAHDCRRMGSVTPWYRKIITSNVPWARNNR